MARLLSVNAGLPRDVAWRGATVHIAIWKEPVSGRRMVRRLNIDGDGQGDVVGHGGEHRAVMVYRLEPRRIHSEVFGPGKSVTPGAFAPPRRKGSLNATYTAAAAD